MAVDGQIWIRTKIDSKGFNSGMKSMLGSLGKLAGALGVVFGVSQLVSFGKQSVEVARKFEERWQGLAFLVRSKGLSFKEVKDYINEYTNDGLVPTMNATKAYMNLLATGFKHEEITQLMQVMKDSAVYLRKGQFEIGDAVEKTTEGIKTERSILSDTSGIERNLYKMWQDYAKSIGKTISSLSDAEKRQAVLNGYLKEGSIYAGAAAQYLNTYAGRAAQLAFAMTQLKEAVGNALIPIINQLLPYIIRLVNWFTRLFNIIGRVMNLLFGTQVAMADIGDGAGDLGDGAGDFGDGMERGAKAAKSVLAAFDKIDVLNKPSAGGGGGGGGELPPIEPPDFTPFDEAIDELDEKLQNFKNRLIDFFQPLIDSFKNLMIALEPAKTFVAEGLQSFWDNFLVPLGTYVFQSFLPDFLNAIAEAAKEIDWDKIGGAFDRLWKALEPFAEQIGNGLLWFYEKVLVPIGKWATNVLFPAVLDLITAAIEALSAIIDSNESLIENFWNNILKPILEFAEALVIAVIQDLTDTLTKFSDWARNNEEAVRIITATLGMFFLVWKASSIGAAIGGVITSIATMTTSLYINVTAWAASTGAKFADMGVTIAIAALYVGDFFVSLWTTITNLFASIAAWVAQTAAKVANAVATAASTVATWLYNAAATVGAAVTTAFGVAMQFLTSPITLVILAIVALIAIIVLLIKNWDKVKEWAINTWEKIKEAWNVASEWFNKKVLQPIKTFFENTWQNITNFVTGVWEAIKTVWQVVKDWFNENVLIPTENFFTEKWDAIKQKVIDIWEGIKTAWNVAKEWFNENVLSPVKDYFVENWELIEEQVNGVWNAIKEMWQGAKDWFNESVLNPISDAFTSIWEGIRDAIKGVINSIVGFINVLIQGVVDGINAVIRTLNLFSVTLPNGRVIGFSIREISSPPLIPGLARGAVIPANAPFLAVLGDQRHGRNLEAPESVIRDILRDELSRISIGNESQNIEITFGGDLGALVRLLEPRIEQERKRKGNSFGPKVRYIQ